MNDNAADVIGALVTIQFREAGLCFFVVNSFA